MEINMKSENNIINQNGGALFDAIGDINDDLVEEAAVITRRTPMIYKKLWITAAVVLTALSLFGGALYFGGRNSTSAPNVPSITESETSETAESTENITETTTPTVSGIIPTETEPEPTTAAVTEPKETTPHTETETDAPISPSESTVPDEPNDTEDTTAAVTDAPSNPGDTIAGVTDQPKPNGPQSTTPGVINPPSTTPSARPPETTVVPTKPIPPPEARPEDYKTVKGPESGISEACLLGKYFSTSSEMAAPPMPYFELSNYDFGVKATVIKSLPDVYYVYNEYSSSPTEYRVILMRAEDVLYGKEVPEYFYYAIESGLYVDMSVYDFLFISMRQLGTDGFVMTNSLDMMTESFPLPVFNSYLPEFGRVIPFTNGIFDESLWQTRSWINGYQFIKTDLNDQTYHDVKRGCTAEYTLEHIKPNDRTHEPTVVTLGDLKSINAGSVSYVTDFANGTFIQYFNTYNKTVTFQRFIYGCKTDEVLKLDTNKHTTEWSDVRYTHDELADQENITKYIANLEAAYSENIPDAPHVSPEDIPLRKFGFTGYYFKYDGKCYGAVSISWSYFDRNYETDLETFYFDQAFILFEDGTPRDISREELYALEPHFYVYMGNYSAIVDYIIHG